MSNLAPGKRVELCGVGFLGTVEHIDSEHVRVRWDDGKIGLLYFDDRMMPNARYLLPLPEPKP